MSKLISVITYIAAILIYLAAYAFESGVKNELLLSPASTAETAVSTSTVDKPSEPIKSVYNRTQDYSYIDNYVNRVDESKPVEVPEEEITMLARLIWGEARGCSAEEQRLVVWTVFQRVDNGYFGGDSIEEVITARNQFMGYNPKNYIDSEIYDMCAEEYLKWQNGEDAPILEPYAPETSYFYFEGRRGEDGKLHNYFRKDWR